jgi:prepilin-type N-terminal cleavage/methylation domain-containing protein
MRLRGRAAFTIVELLVVMAIILVLAGLVLATSSYVHNKGARSRAEAEIAAMSAALENYKADNGVYPSDSTKTDLLSPKAGVDFASYSTASLFLYEKLTGVTSGSRSEVPSTTTYFTFKPNMLLPSPPSTADITGIRDPFGDSYGYSTAGQTTSGTGYNPTFDLWSTGGYIATTSPPDQSQWIKNW